MTIAPTLHMKYSFDSLVGHNVRTWHFWAGNGPRCECRHGDSHTPRGTMTLYFSSAILNVEVRLVTLGSGTVKLV